MEALQRQGGFVPDLAGLPLPGASASTGRTGPTESSSISIRPKAKEFARSFAESMAADSPGRYLTRIAKAERVGRIFLDYLRNDPTSTAVGPCSTRSRAGAPVKTPLDWQELGKELAPKSFAIATVPARLAAVRRDPWGEMDAIRQRLPR